HHDGLCYWDTKTTNNNIMDFPYHRDITADLAKMCRKYGINFGLYLSIIDAHFSKWNRIYPHGAKMPGFPEEIPQIANLTERQGLELIHEFHPFELWFDGGWLDGWRSSKYPKELEEAFRKADPNILLTRLGNYTDDYPSMEAKIGVYRPYPWETVTSIAYPRYSWGPDLHYKSVPFLVETLCRVICGNGNYLLAFIPDVNGQIPEVQQKMAKEMGGWVRKNSEAIFGTRGGPYYPNKWGGSTYRGNEVYLYILSEAPEGFTLPPIDAKILSVSVLSGSNVISVKQTSKGLTVVAPNKEKDAEGVAILKLTLEHGVHNMIEASNPKSALYENIDKDAVPIQDRNGKVLNH
ncbi:MAG: alpha-L-fucosidase, partial [Chitinophagaceae bacterium]